MLKSLMLFICLPKSVLGMRVLLKFIIFTCSLSSLKAQRCDTYNYGKKNAGSSLAANNNRSVSTRDILKDEIIVIPVVIHLLYHTATENISNEQILSQLDVLNKDYRRLNRDTSKTPAAFAPVAADTRITFCLAKKDPEGRPTTGIIRKYTSVENWLSDDGMKYAAQGGDNAWDPKRYLNIWVCNLFGRTLGYSSLPGTQPDKDGLVIKYSVVGTTGITTYPFDKGRTATHEVGHWLGLMHLWGDKSCGNDGIDDTPPQQSFNNGCPSFPHTTACSVNSNGDMFMNFMDLTDDACMNMFTIGQKNKMRSQFAVGGVRNSFLNSTGCDTSYTAEAGPVPAEEIKNISLVIYPNPVTDKLFIKGSNTEDLAGKQLKIYNVLGKIVNTRLLTSQTNIINMTDLPAGIYFLQIGESGETKTFKILKL
jgi:hypothetical protein